MFDPQDINKINLPQPENVAAPILTPQQQKVLEQAQISSTQEILEEERRKLEMSKLVLLPRLRKALLVILWRKQLFVIWKNFETI